jgi:phospholipid transport system substrate-binding protein
MMKRVLLLVICLLPLSGMASPGPGYYYPPGHEGIGLAEPAMVLRKGVETLTGYLDERTGSIHPAQLQQFLEREIAPYFDFDHMSRWAAGSLNRHLGPQHRQQLSAVLKQRFMFAMGEQLMGYRQARLIYLPPRGNPMQGEITLSIRMLSADTAPVQLDFKLYRNQSGHWLVYDVVANGLSAVAHYRHELSQLVRMHGVEGVLYRLEGGRW